MISTFPKTAFFRGVCYLTATTTFLFGFPMSIFAKDPSAPVKVQEKKAAKAVSRLLTGKEMSSLSGKASGNPYFAGQAKFDAVYKGVNLRTGNYSMSATDMNFEGGYGIPVNVTRSYSANDISEGPFGYGWTLSADLRSTAGGVLKSSKAPVRSVPVGMRRRPTTEVDPNFVGPAGGTTQPSEAVIVTDADGQDHTIQRDVDGVLTTPPWDKNEYETEYEYVDQNGGVYWILKSNKTMTPDGTVYQYEKKGDYVYGSKPWSDANASSEPNNVLKPVWVDDRQGNRTTYTYGSSYVNFTKSNGVVEEYPLTGVDMPNGRNLTFVWNGNRIASVTVSSNGDSRTVNYGYTGGQLTSVTTPGGKITRYGYSDNLMTSMTDPRGITTTVTYGTAPYTGHMRVTEVDEANGLSTIFEYGTTTWVSYHTEDSNGNSADLPSATFSYSVSGTELTTVYATGETMGTSTSPQIAKTYSTATYDLASETTSVFGGQVGIPYSNLTPISKKETTYNFFGNPVSETTYEYSLSSPGQVARTISTETGYWGEDKYFQKKIVRVTSPTTPSFPARYSYTDYYDSSAAAGSRGQTYRVYDAKYSTYAADGSTAPQYAIDGGYAWKYTYAPTDLSKYSAQFEYDSKGRATKVWKLQSVVSGTYNYVETDSTYGSDGAPAYGNATTVVEDVNGINRQTQTLEFDIMGKAIVTQNGAGRVFQTNYDDDGLVQSVQMQNGSNWDDIITYTYGTTDGTVENGQPTSIVDGLSGVSQTVTYVQSGDQKGMPLTVAENDGSGQTSSRTYEYTVQGDRAASTVTTPNGTTRYAYSGYGLFGLAGSQNRVFTSVNRQVSSGGNWVNGDEQVEYAFDVLGRLSTAKFAPTPQAGQTNYDTYGAKSYASTDYTYDLASRVTSVSNSWHVLNTGTGLYDSTAVSSASALYAHPLGLKTSETFTGVNPHTESYGYDPTLDYLTSVNYGDGITNTWDYDAAGNRSAASATPGSWVCDNLNRMSASPFASYTHDILGNRVTKTEGGSTYAFGWDAVNRMVSYGPQGGSDPMLYTYRADGMRVKSATQGSYERTYYDGQMPVESDKYSVGSTTVTKNFLGARGLEAITTVTSTSSNTVYPLYDTHGNMVATLSKDSASNSWSLGNQRSYDVWGGVRSGATTGGPKGRYCANLGHVQDDESGLLYMRARYYEPSTGRFISQDPSGDGVNWYAYCSNNPVSFCDESGHITLGDYLITNILALAGLITIGVGIGIAIQSAAPAEIAFGKAKKCILTGFFLLAVSQLLVEDGFGFIRRLGKLTVDTVLPAWLVRSIDTSVDGLQFGKDTSASVAITMTFLYSMAVMFELAVMDWDSITAGGITF